MSQSYTPSIIETGVRSLFMRSLTSRNAGKHVRALANVIQSNKRTEVFAGVGASPRMRLLPPDREIVFDGLTDHRYELTAQTWAGGIVLLREDIEDDQLGDLKMATNNLAKVAAHNPDRLVMQTLLNGTVGLGYDEVPFFSNAHPAFGSLTATQDNILTGSGTSTSQVSADFAAALAQIKSFLDENGEPYHLDDLDEITIVAGPAMEKPLLEALGAGLISNTSNVSVDGLKKKLLVTARMTGNDFIVTHTGGGAKPIVLIERVPLEFTAQEGDSDDGFEREQYKYKVRWRGVPGYGPWQEAVLVDN